MRYTSDQMEYELAEIKAGVPRKWMEMGALFDAVNESGYWRRSSDSFRQWLEDFGNEIGLKRATLWRYISATRKYNYMCRLAKTPPENRIYPSINDLPGYVSPEKIEILEKISRVMPQGDVLDMMSGIIDGTLQRAVLREKWEAYRPAMKGKTARGSMALGELRVNPEDTFQAQKLVEGEIYSSLRNEGAKWLSESQPLFYRLVMNVVPDSFTDSHRFYKDMPCEGIDAVAIIKVDDQSPLEMHAIEISSNIDTNTIDNLNALIWYSHKVWLAVSESEVNDDGLSEIPNRVGILLVSSTGSLRAMKIADSIPNPPYCDCLTGGIISKLCGA